MILINGVSGTKSGWSPCFLRPLAAGEVDPLKLFTLHVELIMRTLQSWLVSDTCTPCRPPGDHLRQQVSSFVSILLFIVPDYHSTICVSCCS